MTKMRRTTAIAGLGRGRPGSCRLQQQRQFSPPAAAAARPAAAARSTSTRASRCREPRRAQTKPMVNGIKLALAAGQQQGRPVDGELPRRSTTPPPRPASGTRARRRPNARKAASDPKAVYYMGEFNSGRQRGLDPDPQPGRAPAGEPGEHVRRPDDEPARQRSRASRRSTTRPGTAPTCGSCRIDSIQAAADLMAMKQAGCTKVAVANDKEAYGAGLATLLELEKGIYGVNDRQQHRDRPDRAELPLLRVDDQGPGSRLLLLRRHRLQRRGPDHQGRQRGAAQGQDLRRRRRLHGLLHEREEGRRPGRRIDPLIAVHGRDPGPGRLPGRQGLPGRLQGQVRRRRTPTRTRSTATRR